MQKYPLSIRNGQFGTALLLMLCMLSSAIFAPQSEATTRSDNTSNLSDASNSTTIQASTESGDLNTSKVVSPQKTKRKTKLTIRRLRPSSSPLSTWIEIKYTRLNRILAQKPDYCPTVFAKVIRNLTQHSRLNGFGGFLRP